MTYPRQAHRPAPLAGLRAIPLLAALAMLFTMSPARAQEDMLARERWSEHSFGLSLRPPADAALYERSIDDSVLRMIVKDQYTINLSINRIEGRQERLEFQVEDPRGFGSDWRPRFHKARREEVVVDGQVESVTIDQVLDFSAQQLGVRQPNAVLKEQRKFRIDKRPGGVIYFRVPGVNVKADAARGNREAPAWVLGMAFMQIDPTTFVQLQLETGEPDFEGARPIFESVVKSMQLAPPQELDKRRDALAEAGEKWRARIRQEDVVAALVGNDAGRQQWFRVMERGEEVGYTRVLRIRDTEMNTRGYRVSVESVTQIAGRRIEVNADYFLAEDWSSEVWAITTKTIGRESVPDPVHLGKMVQKIVENKWSEVGTRTGERITVTRQSPAGAQRFDWTRPPSAYLSQVECFLLDKLLPHDTPAEIGFYAYNPNTGKIAFRTERVAPKPDGACEVYSRPSQDMAEQVSYFDAKGKLLGRAMPGGRVLEASTGAEMAAKWNLKAPPKPAPATPAAPAPPHAKPR